MIIPPGLLLSFNILVNNLKRKKDIMISPRKINRMTTKYSFRIFWTGSFHYFLKNAFDIILAEG